MEEKNGLIHLYYGDGKGKTTAVIGLSIRAAGNGMKIAFVQFMKGGYTSELSILSGIEGIDIYRSDRNFGFFDQMSQEDKNKITDVHNQILKEVTEKSKQGIYDLVVLDEITHADRFGLVDRSLLEHFLKSKPKMLEIAMTGRDPEPFLLEKADYASEIRCIKHPYSQGITARKGIEY